MDILLTVAHYNTKCVQVIKVTRLQGTGQNCGLVSRNRPVSTGFFKGTLVSFLILDTKKVLYLEVYAEC